MRYVLMMMFVLGFITVKTNDGYRINAREYNPKDDPNPKFQTISDIALVSCTDDTTESLNIPENISLFYQKQYNLQLNSEDNLDLYHMVYRWWRTPYRYGGLSRRGLDCSGLVKVLNDSLYNISLPGGAGAMYNVSQKIEKNELKEGDLIFFKIGVNFISHVGLYLKNNKFVHATSCCGVIINDLNDPYYKRWYFASGRIADNKALYKF